jgi:hypothetical protein
MPGKSLFSVPESATRVLKSERRSLRRIILLCNRRHRESGHHTVRVWASGLKDQKRLLDVPIECSVRGSYNSKPFLTALEYR